MGKQTPQRRVLFVRTLQMTAVGVLFAFLTLLPGLKATTGHTAAATTDSTVTFQARLLLANGSTVPDGNYNLEFKLYDAASGGTNLWTETRTSGNRVQVVDGFFTVNLGSVTAFPSTINWDQDLYVTMNVGGSNASPSWDGEMNPRIHLTAVPYAFRAGQLAQLNTSNGFSSTLQLLQPTGGTQTFQIGDQGAAGTYTLCIQNSTSCGFAPTSGSNNYIQNQTAAAQTSAGFWISGTGTADTFNAVTALQTGGVTRIDASGNGSFANIAGTGTLQLSGTTGSSYIMSSLGLGTTSPQSGSALTIANNSWISAVDASGSSYINMFQVNANNEIQVGAALNVDGGIILPTDAGQVTLSDLPVDSNASAGTKESYTLRVGSTNALTVYGEADGSGGIQNVRVAIGSSIAPGYTLDVGGAINTSGGLSTGSVARLDNAGNLTNVNYQGSTIAVQYGGTGAATFTQYGVIYGNGTGALQATAGGATGQCLMGNTSAAPTWGSCLTGSAGNYIQNGTTTQVANFNIQSAAVGSVTATIQAMASQTADVLDISLAGESLPRVSVNASGQLAFSNGSTASGVLYGTNVGLTTGGNQLSVGTTLSYAKLSVSSVSVGGVGLGIRNVSGQTADQVEIQDFNGNVLSSFTANGALNTNGTANVLNGLAYPGGLAITQGGTPGSTTYAYRVSALNSQGETTAAPEVTTATGPATLNATNYNIVSWNAVPGATSYKVYGRTSGGELLMATVTSNGAATYSWNDTGTVTPSGALPSGSGFSPVLTINGGKNTGNVFQVKNQAAASVFAIDNGSGLTTINASSVISNASANTVTALQVQNNLSTTVAAFIQGASSQSADLLQFKDNLGTVQGGITNAGGIYNYGANNTFNGIGQPTWVTSSTGTTYYYKVQAYTLTGDGLATTALGMANNTSTLTWTAIPGARGYKIFRNTSATFDGTAGSNLFLNTTTSTSYTDTGSATTAGPPSLPNNTSVTGTGLTIQGWAGQTAALQILKNGASSSADLLQFQSSGGTNLARFDSNGNLYTSNSITVGAISNFASNVSLQVKPIGASNAGEIIRGLSSQTGDLLDFQNSNGDNLSVINSNGSLTLGRSAASGTLQNGLLTLQDGSNTNGYGVQLQSGALTAGQTITLGNQSGTICLQNSASCGFVTGSTGSFIQNTTTVQTSANFYIRSAATGSVAGVIEGANGQTADLLDLNTYNGTSSTTVAKFDSAGNFYLNGGKFQADASGNISLNNNNSATGSFSFNGGGTGARFSVSNSGSTAINIQNSGVVGLTVKGVSGQTADLTDLQDSNGNILTSYDASGNLHINATGVSDTLGSFAVGNSGTGNQISNPSFETNATGWFGNSATISRVTTTAYSGSAALEATTSATANAGAYYPGATATAGSTYTASVYLKASSIATSATVQVRINWQGASGSLGVINGSVVTLSSGWQRSVVSGVAPAGTTGASVYVYTIANTSGDKFDLDAAQFELGGLTPYIGGTHSAGDLTASGNFSVQGAIVSNGGAKINSASASSVGLQVQGIDAQSADLLQFVDSTNTVLSRIDSTGRLQVGGTSTNRAIVDTGLFSSTRGLTTDQALKTQVSGDTNNRFVIAADGTISWGNGTAATDTTLYRNAAGQIGVQGLYASANISVGLSTTPGKLSVQPGNAGTLGIVARGFSGQTADLFEVQNSNSDVLTSFNGNGSLTLGRSAASGALQNGLLTLTDGSNTNGFGTLLQSGALTTSRTITFGDQSGTVCLQSSTACGFVVGSAGSFLARNAADTSSASVAGTLYGFTNTNTGAAGVLSLTNAGTNSALSVTQSGNPTSGQALIYANNSNASPSGNLLLLQSGGASKFTVTSGGAVTATGNVSGAGFTSSAASNFTISSATSANNLTLTSNNTQSGATNSTVNGISVIATGTATSGGINTNNGISFANVTPQTNNVFNGLQFGTGYDYLINSTNFSVTGAGALTAAGLITGNAGATIAGGAINLNSSSNFATNINTGSSTGAVTIGNASSALSLQGNGATAATNIFAVRVSGDTNDRFTIGADGKLSWGTGSATTDTTITRTATGGLTFNKDIIDQGKFYAGLDGGANVNIGPTSSGQIGVAIKGQTSQTGDLLQFQNNSGDVLGKFNSNGSLTLGRSAASGTLQNGLLTLQDGSNTNGYGVQLQSGALTAGQTITLGNQSGTICLQGSASCGFAATNNATSYIWNGTTAQTANFNITSANTNSVTATIQGASGQSADVLDVVGTQGTLSVANTGATLSFSRAGANVINTTGSGSTLGLGTGSRTNDVFINSSGLVGIGTSGSANARLEVGGGFNGGMSASGVNIRADGITANDNIAAGNTRATAAINGIGQNTLGATNTGVTTTDASNLYVQGPVIAGSNQTITNSYGLQIGAGSSVAGSGTVTNSYGLSVTGGTGATNNYGAIFKTGAAGNVGQIVQGASSQTADLFELQNSSGTILSKFDASGNLSLGTALSYGALTLANNAWITAVDSTGASSVNVLKVNSNNEIQLGAALNVDGGIILPADGGALTVVDMPFSSGITAGTANSYTFGIGQSNALTVYGENDGSGNAQNVRVAIGSGIQPAYTLDVQGDINASGNIRQGGTVRIDTSGNVLANNLETGGGTIRIDASGNLSNVTYQGATISVQYGGTGTTSFTPYGLLYGNNSSAIGATAAGTTGQCLVGNTGAAPSWTACATGSAGSYIQNGTTLQTTANFNIQSASASSVGAIVQGASGQTADILEVKDGSGNVRASFNNAGSLVISDGTNQVGIISSNPASGTQGRLYLGTDGASNVGQVIQGAGSQTADLFELQNSSSNVLASFNNVGTLTIGRSAASGTNQNGFLKVIDGSNSNGFGTTLQTGALTNNRAITFGDQSGTICLQSSTACGFAATTGATGYIQNGTTTQTANFNIQSASASSVGAIVQGAASQTADIFDVLTSGNSNLFKVTTTGTTSGAYFNATAGAYITTGAPATPVVQTRATTGQTADIQQYQDISGSVLSGINANGGIYSNGTNNTFNGLATPAFTTASSGTSFYYVITATNAAGETVGSTALGMANNTSALAWNQVAGATGYKIYRNTTNSFTSGTLLRTTITNGTTTTFTDNGAATSTGLPPTAPTGTGLTIQGWASQSGNLATFQSSGGSTVAKVSNNGDFLGQVGVFGSTSCLSVCAQLNALSRASTAVGLNIQGASGQSADLLELRDSGNNLLTNFDATGYLHFAKAASASDNVLSARVSGDSNDRFTVGADGKLSWGPGNAATDSSIARVNGNIEVTASTFRTSGSLAVNAYPSTSTRLYVGAASSSTLGFVVKGASGQTADQFELQNNNGDVQASFNGNGYLTLGRSAATGTNYNGQLTLVDGSNTSGFGVLLQSGALTAGQTITLGNQSGTICLQNSASCGFLTGSPGNYIQNGTSQQTANFNILSAATGSVAATIQGAASGTADILDVNNGAGTAVFKVNATNDFISTAVNNTVGGLSVGGTYFTHPGKLYVGTAGAANVGEVLRGAASQTGDLQQNQDTNGALLSGFNGNGGLYTNGTNNTFGNLATPTWVTSSSGVSFYYVITAVNGAGETVASAGLGLPNNSSTIQWNQVAGASSYKIYRNNSNSFTSGSLLLTTITNGTTTSYTDTGSATSAGLPPTSVNGTGLTLQAWNNQTNNVFQVLNAAGSVNASIIQDGSGYFNGTLNVGVNSGNAKFNVTTSGTTVAQFNANAATTIGEVIKGAASQSGDYLQLQDSSSNVLTNFDSKGYLHVARAAAASDNVLSVRVAGDTNDRFTIGADGKLSFGPGNAAQDMNITRYDSAHLGVSAGLRVGGQEAIGSIISGSYRFGIDTVSAGTSGEIIKASASQTADLFQLQASDNSSVLTSFNNNGSLTLGRSAASGVNQNGLLTVIDGSNNSGFGVTLQSGALTANHTITLGNQSGTICLQSSASCGFVTGSAGSFIANGTGTQTANFNIQSASSSSIAGIIQGASSQSVDIFEVKTSSTTAFSVGNNGWTTANNGLSVGSSYGGGGKVQVYSASAGTVAETLRGVSAQTADLQQNQENNGAVLSGFNANGGLYTNGTNNTIGNLAVPTWVTTSTGLTYFYVITATNAAGETTQSTTLALPNNTSTIQWNQVAGATGYKIYRNISNSFTAGNLLLTTITNGTTTSYTDTGSATASGLPPTAPAGSTLTVQGWASQSNSIFNVVSSANNSLFNINSNGWAYTNGLANITSANNANVQTNTSGTKIVTSVAGNVALAIQNANASPTADLLDLQDTSGNVLTNFDSKGYLHVARAASGTDNVINVRVSGDTNDRFTIDANGQLRWGPGNAATDIGLSRQGTGVLQTGGSFRVGGSTAGTLGVTTSASSALGLVVKATSGQSVDLIQLQDSSANALSSFGSNGMLVAGRTGASGLQGSIYFADGGSANTAAINVAGTLSGNVVFQLPTASAGTYQICTTASVCAGYSGAGTGYIQNGTTTQSANFNIQSASSSSIGAIIQGASGQSVDIFQVKTSSAVVAKVDSAGLLHAIGLRGETSSASTVAIVAKGTTSQTADLQQNQDVNGNVLSGVNANGGIYSYGNTSTFGGLSTPQNVLSSVPGTTRYYKISALNAAGETTGSLEISGGAATTISWDPVNGATSYRVYRGTSSGAENVYITVNGPATSLANADTATATSGSPLATASATNPVMSIQGWGNTGNSNNIFQVLSNTGGSALTVNGFGNGKFSQGLVVTGTQSVGCNSTAAAFCIQSANTGSAGQIIQQVSGQTANLFQLQDTSGNVFDKFDANGGLFVQPNFVPTTVVGNGTDATAVLTVTGGVGGATSSSGQTGGAGAAISLTAGQGGAAPAGGTNGRGGNITLQGGAPGSGAGNTGTYGNIILQASGGNVGIGISAPTQTLQVNGNIAAFTTASTTALNATYFLFNNTGTSGGWGTTNFGNTLSYDSGTSRYENLIFGASTGDVVIGSHANGTAPTGPGSFTRNLVVRGDTGRVGIGLTNPGYQLDVNGDINIASGSAYKIGGTNICTSSGCAPAGGSTNYIQNGTTSQTANFFVTSASAGSVVGILQGASGQTADLLQAKNSSGIAFDVDASGNVAVAGATINGAALNVSTGVASNKGLVIQGKPSQSADFMQLQNSNGDILTKFNNNGSLTLGRSAASGTSQNGLLTVIDGSNTNGFGVTLQSGALTANRTITFGDQAGTICLQSSSACGFALTSTSGSYVQLAPSSAQGDSSTNSSIFINKTAASGNILELQKSGSDVVNVSNSGLFNAFAGALVTPGSAGGIGVQIQARASQTADLEQFQNNNGIVLGKVDANGNTLSYGANTTLAALASPTITNGSTGTNFYYGVTATNAQGETAVGTPIAMGSTTSTITWNQVPGATGYKIYRTTQAIYTATGFTTGSLLLTTITNGTTLSYNDANGTTSAGNPPAAPTGSGLTIQGWNNQGGNAFQIQNSGGSTVIGATAGGSLGVLSNFSVGSLTAIANTKASIYGFSGYTTLALRNASSTPGDLLQLQDSSGNVQTNFDSTGYLHFARAAASTDNVISARVNGDTNDRLNITAAGALFWGPGNAASDVNLSRTAANLLTVSNNFKVSGTLNVGATTPSGSYRTYINTASTTETGMVVQSVSGQSADFLQFQDFNGNALSRFTNNGQLILGLAGTGAVQQGSLKFADGTTDNFMATLNTTTLTNNQTISLPNESGTICLQGSTNCNFAAASGSANYIQNQTASAQAASYNISGTATIGSNLTGNTALFKNSANSTAAFQIQNASGINTLVVDTTNNMVTVGTSLSATLFSDNFESGSFSTNGWVANVGAGGTTPIIDNTLAHGGTYSAKVTQNGVHAYEEAPFTQTSSVIAQAYVYVSSQAASQIDIMDVLTPSDGAGYSFIRKSTGAVCIWDGTTAQTPCSSSILSLNAWHLIQLKFVAGSGTTGWLSASVDGTTLTDIIFGSNPSYGMANTGTTGVANIRIGYGLNSTASSVVNYDDVQVAPPATTPGLNSINGLEVNGIQIVDGNQNLMNIGNITSPQAATWSTTTGDLTIQGGSGNVSLGTSTKLTAAGALTLQAGTGGTGNNNLTLAGGGTGTIQVTSLANFTAGATITVGSSSSTSPLVVQAGVSGTAPTQVIKGNTSNTQDALQVQSSGGIVQTKVDSNGSLTTYGTQNKFVGLLTPGSINSSVVGTTNYYKVTALNALGETAATSEVSGAATTTISWNPVNGATSYRVYRGTSSNGENVYITVAAPTVSLANAGTAGTSGSGTPPLVSTNTTPVVTVQGWGTNDTNGLFQVTRGDGTSLFTVTNGGYTYANNGLQVGGAMTCGTGAATLCTLGGGSNPTIVAQAGSGQTGDTFEVQNSSSTVLARFDATGNLITKANIDVQGTSSSVHYFQTTSSAITMQDSTGVNGLVFTSGTHTLNVYDSTGTNSAQIYYSGGAAIFSASAGVTQIGATSGNVSVPLTGQNDAFTFTKTYTPSAAYANTDFTIQRILTGGANALTGNVLKVEDRSTGTNNNATVLYLNENNTSAGGYIIQAQTGGTTNQLTLDTSGNLAVNGGYAVGANTGIDTACSTGQELTNVTVNGGIVTAGSCGNSSATLQGVYDNSSSPATITTSSSSKGILIKAGASADSTALFQLQNSGSVALLTADSTNKVIQIGSSTSDGNLVDLALDQYNTFADSGSCNTSANPNGALYYNSVSNTIRACINGGWEDLASTSGLGILTFGVVPDSGSNPGDLAATTTAGVTGPCKVSWASSTSVNIAACNAYSGGRKVSVSATTITITGMTTTNIWEHICLTGTNNQPALSTAAANETSNMPTFSQNNPILCLADVKGSTSSANTIDDLYDTRTFTNTDKVFANLSTAGGLGQIVMASGANAIPANAANSALVEGVVVATNGSTSTTTPNAIIAIGGPTYAKAASGTAGDFVTSLGTTAGYAQAGATSAAFGDMGINRTTWATTCTSASSCLGALYFDMSIK